MLDVIVKLIRDGVVVNSNGNGNVSSGRIKENEATAALGKAVLGTMKLGAA